MNFMDRKYAVFYKGKSQSSQLREQQSGVLLMFWTGVFRADIIGPIKAADGVKIIGGIYRKFVDDNIFNWCK